MDTLAHNRAHATSEAESARYIIELEAAPDALRRPAIVRLRAALKLLLRGYGLRCVSVRPADDGEVSR